MLIPVFAGCERGNPVADNGNTPGNISNGGMVAEHDGWIYYSNGYHNGWLYRMKPDGSENTLIVEDYAEGINVVNDSIYYVNRSDHRKIYRIKNDGTERTILNENFCTQINVVSDWVYYVIVDDEHCIYKMKTNSTEQTKLNSEYTYNIMVVGEWLYYSIKGYQLKKMKTDGTGVVLLDEKCYSFLDYWDGKVYYLAEDGIYSINSN
ncbi:MAG: hypothetical protein A2Y17_08110 [Clostridiales bacterium GWF2_38_85]|nr:MAG: hypothetical protein A2Y17_08110 [Clostridiales bacterium GWF2_38_85]HBL83844.1 hypothetical protein [Clostridiales bacterium]